MGKTVRFRMQDGDDTGSTMADAQTTLDYFTCTLGEAARWNEAHPHPFATVNHLVDEQAAALRQRPAVNFPGGCAGQDGRRTKSGRTPRSSAAGVGVGPGSDA